MIRITGYLEIDGKIYKNAITEEGLRNMIYRSHNLEGIGGQVVTHMVFAKPGSQVSRSGNLRTLTYDSIKDDDKIDWDHACMIAPSINYEDGVMRVSYSLGDSQAAMLESNGEPITYAAILLIAGGSVAHTSDGRWGIDTAGEVSPNLFQKSDSMKVVAAVVPAGITVIPAQSSIVWRHVYDLNAESNG